MAYPALSTLKLERAGGLLAVTIDHPPVNLMDRTMIRELRALLAALKEDSEVRCVVFRSANPEFFISHLDLTLVAKGLDSPPTRPTELSNLQALFEGYRLLDKATIGVAEGRMNGAGTELFTCLDMRFAARGKAFIGQFEVALGCLPGATGSQRLPALAGRARALELILGCDEIDADIAERYGIVNRVMAPDELPAFVDNLARRIASFPARAIALAKQAVDAGAGNPLEGLLEEGHLAGRLMALPDTKRRFERILALGAQTPEGERRLSGLLPRLGEGEK